MKSHQCSRIVPAKLAFHNDSHAISKLKPKIRIIHIVAPEIIKTDAQNFRELVQRLTGKPEERKESEKKGNDFPSVAFPSKMSGRKSRKNMKSASVPALQIKHRIKENEEIIWGESPSAFLGFLGDVDGYGFPLLPFRSSQISTFEWERIVSFMLSGQENATYSGSSFSHAVSYKGLGRWLSFEEPRGHRYPSKSVSVTRLGSSEDVPLEVLDAVEPVKMESSISVGSVFANMNNTPIVP